MDRVRVGLVSKSRDRAEGLALEADPRVGVTRVATYTGRDDEVIQKVIDTLAEWGDEK